MSRNASIRRLTGWAAVLAVVLAVAAAPAVAAAAPAQANIAVLSATLDTDPSGTGATYIVGATLATGTAMPAVVELPVPSGSTVVWSGEIMGTSGTNDVEDPHTVVKANGYDLVRFTVTKSTDVQAEAQVADAVTISGQTRTETISLAIPYKVERGQVSMRAPSDATVVKKSPELKASPAPDGWTYYNIDQPAPAAGSVIGAQLSYSGGTVPQGTATQPPAGTATTPAGAAGGTQPAATGGSNLIVPLLIVLVVILAFVAYLALRKRPDTEAATEKTPDEAEKEEEAPSEEESDEDDVDDILR